MSNRERNPEARHGACALRILLRGGLLVGILVATFQAAVLGSVLPPTTGDLLALDGEGISSNGIAGFLTVHLALVAAIATLFMALPLSFRIVERWRARRAANPVQGERLADFERLALFLGLVTMAFLLGVVHLFALANLARSVAFSSLLPIVVVGYVTFAAAWTLHVVHRFRPRDTTPNASPASA